MKKILRITKIKLLLIVLAVGLVFVLSKNRSSDIEYKIDEVKLGDVVEELVLTGEIKATEYTNLQFNSSGTLSWIGVNVGDLVEKGSALAKLDTTLLNTSYQKALSDLRYAEASVNRVHDDLKGKESTDTFLEKETRIAAEVAHDKAYEAFVYSQKSLRDATLSAPFNGLITFIANESSGINITAGTPQITIVNPETIYFEVNADQTEVARFQKADKAIIILDAYDDKKLSGEVTSVSLTPNPGESGTVYQIRLALHTDNVGYDYKVGMTGDASFELSRKTNVLYVPTNYINTDKEGKYLLVNDGKDKRYVELGIEGNDRVEVKGDIHEGEKIFD